MVVSLDIVVPLPLPDQDIRLFIHPMVVLVPTVLVLQIAYVVDVGVLANVAIVVVVANIWLMLPLTLVRVVMYIRSVYNVVEIRDAKFAMVVKDNTLLSTQ